MYEIRTLEAGKYADIIILEKDPRKVKPTSISEIAIQETRMKVKKVYQKK